jgi:hypothetical protein
MYVEGSSVTSRAVEGAIKLLRGFYESICCKWRKDKTATKERFVALLSSYRARRNMFASD